jgi:hypothetical protein
MDCFRRTSNVWNIGEQEESTVVLYPLQCCAKVMLKFHTHAKLSVSIKSNPSFLLFIIIGFFAMQFFMVLKEEKQKSC